MSTENTTTVEQPAPAAVRSSDGLGRVLTCVYCGHEYPQDSPAWGNQGLTDHIKVCEKHPMRKLEADNAKLRKALVGLVPGGGTILEGLGVASDLMSKEDSPNTKPSPRVRRAPDHYYENIALATRG